MTELYAEHDALICADIWNNDIWRQCVRHDSIICGSWRTDMYWYLKQRHMMICETCLSRNAICAICVFIIFFNFFLQYSSKKVRHVWAATQYAQIPMSYVLHICDVYWWNTYDLLYWRKYIWLILDAMHAQIPNTPVICIPYATSVDEIHMSYCIWGNMYDILYLRKYLWHTYFLAGIHMSHLLHMPYVLRKYVWHIVFEEIHMTYRIWGNTYDIFETQCYMRKYTCHIYYLCYIYWRNTYVIL